MKTSFNFLTEVHAMLKELADKYYRSMAKELEYLIRKEYAEIFGKDNNEQAEG